MSFPVECLDEQQLFHHLGMLRLLPLPLPPCNVYCMPATYKGMLSSAASQPSLELNLQFLIINMVHVGDTLLAETYS